MTAIQNGIDRISDYDGLLRGKRIGLITAPTGLDAEFRSTIDLLHERYGLAALFSPEHGVRGNLGAGDLVDAYVDPQTGVPVYSLYRKDSKRLTEEMLREVDIVVYDIQDVGTRYYTFIYTMLYALEDCAAAGIPFVVLDRIDPLDGVTVEGNVLREEFSSFVGGYPLAVRYGLTAGEVASMANAERGWNAELHVAECRGWKRGMLFPETGRAWIPPSMGIPRFHTALLYPGTCLFEGTNLSEGRGTTAPFETIGAPFVDGEVLAKEMNGLKLPGVHFRPVHFNPYMSKHQGSLCGGVYVHVLDVRALRPVETGVRLLFKVRELFPAFEYLAPYRKGGRPFIDLLGGDEGYRTESPDALLERFADEGRLFAERKKAYHLYE